MIDLTKPTLFEADFYVRHNQRRLEHLASLGLDLTEKTVLEPGPGIGDHSLFYLDRGCHVTAVEPRAENCKMFRQKMEESWTPNAGQVRLIQGSTDKIADLNENFDIVHCYGLLYHVQFPQQLIKMLSDCTKGFMVLETCVSMNIDIAVNPIDEPSENPAQSFEGKGCRPTRPWIMQALGENFAHVYATATQPAHDEFPTDWTKPWKNRSGLTRSVFVGSNHAIKNPALLKSLPDRQTWTLSPNG